MLPASVSAPVAEQSATDLVAEYLAHLALTGRGHSQSELTVRSFLRRWPQPQRWADQPLVRRPVASPQDKSVVAFLMAWGHLRPGYDYLVRRKLSSFWRETTGTALGEDMERFCRGAEAIGFTPVNAFWAASQSVGRLCIQSAKRLDDLSLDDFEELRQACSDRERRTGEGWGHYRGALTASSSTWRYSTSRRRTGRDAILWRSG
jgi:hypothetical protein